MSVNSEYLPDCKRALPEWAPENGAVSSFQELLSVLNTPLGYLWIAILALFIWKGTLFSALWLVAASIALAVWNWVGYNLSDDLYLGQKGGCVGSLTATYLILLGTGLLGVSGAFVRCIRREF